MSLYCRCPKAAFLLLPLGLIFSCGHSSSSGGGDRQPPNGAPGGNARGQAQVTAACSATSVRQIDLPMLPDVADSPQFSYSYSYTAATTAGAPTLVYVPGGPGQTAIGEEQDWLGRLPDGSGLLLVDPRGVGCNAYHNQDNPLPDEAFKSRYVAADINAAIKHEGLQDYLLYGISYGTVVATIMASQAEAGAAPAPHAVLLEGTVGRAFAPGQADDNYARLWQAQLDGHPEYLSAFANADTLPLGYSNEQWLTVIRSTLMYGVADINKRPVNFLGAVLAAATSPKSERQAQARKVIDSLIGQSTGSASPIGSDGAARFYVFIACQEIWPSLNAVTLDAGKMVTGSDNLCQQQGLNLSLGPEAFDAAKWPIKAPIYYFQGGDDPAVPVPLAQYHFASQTTSVGRQLLLVGKGGHNPLEISLDTCDKQVLAQLGAGATLNDSLAHCHWLPGLSLTTAAGTQVLEAPVSDTFNDAVDPTPVIAELSALRQPQPLRAELHRASHDRKGKLGSITGS